MAEIPVTYFISVKPISPVKIESNRCNIKNMRVIIDEIG
jgi:hypothetical protein